MLANKTGGFLHPNSPCRCLRHLTVRDGVLAIHFRDLRLTSATPFLAEGVRGKIVQERLGHANIAMTLDHYSHVTADLQRPAADAIEAAIDAAIAAAERTA